MILIGNETDEIIKELFESVLQKYQKRVFDSVDFLYNKLDKISLNPGGSYVDSPKW